MKLYYCTSIFAFEWHFCVKMPSGYGIKIKVYWTMDGEWPLKKIITYDDWKGCNTASEGKCAAVGISKSKAIK